MSDGSPEPPPEDLDARLRKAKAERAKRKEATDRPSRGGGLSFALRIGTELVVGIAVGAGVGLALDHWLGTAPWLLIVFFFLGAGAGMLNVYRTAMGLGHSVGYRKNDEAQASGRKR